jgi:hypothetical protein
VTTAKYVIDPSDPRAPTHEQWLALSEIERLQIVDQLPSEVPRETALALDEARKRAEDAEQRATEETQRADAAEARAQLLVEQLLKLGITETD